MEMEQECGFARARPFGQRDDFSDLRRRPAVRNQCSRFTWRKSCRMTRQCLVSAGEATRSVARACPASKSDEIGQTPGGVGTVPNRHRGAPDNAAPGPRHRKGPARRTPGRQNSVDATCCTSFAPVLVPRDWPRQESLVSARGYVHPCRTREPEELSYCRVPGYGALSRKHRSIMSLLSFQLAVLAHV